MFHLYTILIKIQIHTVTALHVVARWFNFEEDFLLYFDSNAQLFDMNHVARELAAPNCLWTNKCTG